MRGEALAYGQFLTAWVIGTFSQSNPVSCYSACLYVSLHCNLYSIFTQTIYTVRNLRIKTIYQVNLKLRVIFCIYIHFFQRCRFWYVYMCLYNSFSFFRYICVYVSLCMCRLVKGPFYSFLEVLRYPTSLRSSVIVFPGNRVSSAHLRTASLYSSQPA